MERVQHQVLSTNPDWLGFIQEIGAPRPPPPPICVATKAANHCPRLSAGGAPNNLITYEQRREGDRTGGGEQVDRSSERRKGSGSGCTWG